MHIPTTTKRIFCSHASSLSANPCCQIDLYSILARAPPAELGSVAGPNPGGDGEDRGGCVISKKAKKHRPERGSSQKLVNVESRGGRRAFSNTVGQPLGDELGGYLARDPLGEEVAALDAKARESLRRRGT